MRPDEYLHDANNSKKIVVADTSPLNYLVQMSCEFLLPVLYQRVVIPPAVVVELSRQGTPQSVSAWASEFPAWVEVRSPITMPDAGLLYLGNGEREAIQLALELGILTILIDEHDGRQEATLRKLITTGTLGVLIAVHRAELINAREVFNRLIRTTTFRSTAALRQAFYDLL